MPAAPCDWLMDMTEKEPIRAARLLALIEMPAPAIRASLAESFPFADADALTRRALAEHHAFSAELARAVVAQAA